MKISENQLLIAGGGVIIAGLLWVASKGAAGTGAAIGSGAVNLVDGVLSGGVKGVGGVVGIPDTSQTQCERDLAAGDKWAASFSCPALTFLKHVFN